MKGLRLPLPLLRLALLCCIVLVLTFLVFHVRAHARRIPFRDVQKILIHELPRPLKTGDLILSLHDAHMSTYKTFGALGQDLASFATLHAGVVWVHPVHGPCLVQGVNGTFVGRSNLSKDEAQSALGETDCTFDALTGKHFVFGVSIVPLERFLGCYDGTIMARLLRDGIDVNETAFEAMLEGWLLKQPFRSDFSGSRFHACCGRAVVGHALGFDKLQVDSGGVVCSEVVAVALAAAGLWEMLPDPKCPYEDGEAVLKKLSPTAAGTLQKNKTLAIQLYGDATLQGTDIVKNIPPTKKQHEHMPMDFSSKGDALARLFYGPEIALRPASSKTDTASS